MEKTIKYTLRYVFDPGLYPTEGGYTGWVPEVKGVTVQAQTLEELKEDAIHCINLMGMWHKSEDTVNQILEFQVQEMPLEFEVK